MRYSEREREPYRDNDEDDRGRTFRGNGGRYGEPRHPGEEDFGERDRSRPGRSREHDSREEWPRQSTYGNEGPSWLREQGTQGSYGTSTYGSVYGSPYGASYNDPWFRGERAWRPESDHGERGYRQGRYGEGSYGGPQWSSHRGGYGASEGGYASPGSYGGQSHGGYGQSPYGQGHQDRYGQEGSGIEGRGGYGQGRYDEGRYGRASHGGYGEGRYDQGGYGRPASGERGWRGSSYGKGPKGYQRSDERLREEISDRLMAHPDIDASQVTIEVKSAEVTLEGTVEDRLTKREIEDLVESVMGVKDTNNRIRVQSQLSRSNEGENEGSSWQKSGTASLGASRGSTSKTGKLQST